MHILDRLVMAIKFFFQLNDSRTAAENMLKEATMRHLEAHDAVMYYTCQREYFAQRITYLRDYLGYDVSPAQPGLTPTTFQERDSHVPERARV